METSIKIEQKFYILIVEDEPIIQKIHKSMLEDLGCHVDIASDGYQAIRMLIDNWDYHAILMDIGLPDITWIYTAKKLKQIGIPQINSIPIFGVTAYQIDDELKSECVLAGFKQLLAKPLSISVLKGILSDISKNNYKS